VNNRPRQLFVSAIVAGLVTAAFAQSPAPRVPVPPIPTALGTLPGVSELPARPELPAVLAFEDGSPVRTPADWRTRRLEMKRLLSYYATGQRERTRAEVGAVARRDGPLQTRTPRIRPGREARIRRCDLRACGREGPGTDGSLPHIRSDPGRDATAGHGEAS
jgi:hypothetical protein